MGYPISSGHFSGGSHLDEDGVVFTESLAALIRLPRLPVLATVDRPSPAVVGNGRLILNSDSGRLEYTHAGSWRNLNGDPT